MSFKPPMIDFGDLRSAINAGDWEVIRRPALTVEQAYYLWSKRPDLLPLRWWRIIPAEGDVAEGHIPVLCIWEEIINKMAPKEIGDSRYLYEVGLTSATEDICLFTITHQELYRVVARYACMILRSWYDTLWLERLKCHIGNMRSTHLDFENIQKALIASVDESSEIISEMLEWFEDIGQKPWADMVDVRSRMFEKYRQISALPDLGLHDYNILQGILYWGPGVIGSIGEDDIPNHVYVDAWVAQWATDHGRIRW